MTAPKKKSIREQIIERVKQAKRRNIFNRAMALAKEFGQKHIIVENLKIIPPVTHYYFKAGNLFIKYSITAKFPTSSWQDTKYNEKEELEIDFNKPVFKAWQVSKIPNSLIIKRYLPGRWEQLLNINKIPNLIQDEIIAQKAKSPKSSKEDFGLIKDLSK